MARPDLYAAADDALVWLDENGLDDENYLDGVFSEAEMQFARDNAHRFEGKPVEEIAQVFRVINELPAGKAKGAPGVLEALA